MATNKTTKKKAGVPVAGVAAGVAAAAAAAGAAYYFYGSKKAKAHRRKAAAWAGGFKRDVVREARKLQKLDDTVMHEIVDRVAGTYRAAKAVDPKELMDAANELKDNWQRLRAELRSTGGRAKKAVKADVRKPAKRSAKKTARKRA